jgi:hypothetical protein
MTTSALLMMLAGLTITWGGALICLLIAHMKRKQQSASKCQPPIGRVA